MNRMYMNVGMACAAVLLAACSNTAMIRATQPHTQLTLKGHPGTELPARMDLSTTTFGNYEFEARQNGHAPMYGVLPLDFQGGNLTLDVLFFMPAIWFNLRGAYEQYEIDVAHGVIRYRNDSDEPWQTYQPSPDDMASARAQFGADAVARVAKAPETDADADTTTPAAMTAPAQNAPANPSERAVCDTRRTGIICPDDPSRHTGSH